MNNVGYLYVLANSAMPGLVKVGKTTRSPAERAAELSCATGLPTPFIVVYEQMFDDCSAAESFVHTYLATKGFRVSDNREFFSSPVNDVVRAIALAPGSIDGNSIQSSANELMIDFFDQHELDELDDLHLGTLQTAPWKSVFEDAENHFHGLGESLQDYKEAMRLYVQAAKLGSLGAYSRIAGLYRDGEGVPVSMDLAFKYNKEGARKGNVYCYWAIGMLFWSRHDSNKRNAVNAEKCFVLFLKNLTEDLPDQNRLSTRELNSIVFDCVVMLGQKLTHHDATPAVLEDFFIQKAEKIKLRALSSVEFYRETNDVLNIEAFQSVVDHLS